MSAFLLFLRCFGLFSPGWVCFITKTAVRRLAIVLLKLLISCLPDFIQCGPGQRPSECFLSLCLTHKHTHTHTQTHTHTHTHTHTQNWHKYMAWRLHIVHRQTCNCCLTLTFRCLTFPPSAREWYSYHFPELVKIINDNYMYARVAAFIKSRKELTEDRLEALEEIIMDSAKARAILDASKSSMGKNFFQRYQFCTCLGQFLWASNLRCWKIFGCVDERKPIG